MPPASTVPIHREFRTCGAALRVALDLSNHSSIPYYVHSYRGYGQATARTFYAVTAQPYHEGCHLEAQVRAGNLLGHFEVVSHASTD